MFRLHFHLSDILLIEEIKFKKMIKRIVYIGIMIYFPFSVSAQKKPDYAKSSTNIEESMKIPEAPQMTIEVALEITKRVREQARLAGKEISIAILDASGQTILLSRGNGVGPHNTEAARRKAYTAASTKSATLALARSAQSNPDTRNLANLPELLLLAGGVPLWYNGKLLGAVGVAGGGGAEYDDQLAKLSALPEYFITIEK